MASAADWVRQTVASSQDKPMTTEAVLKSLERHVGQGDRARERVQAILEYIDGELIERRGGLALRRPQIAALNLVAVGLVLINPPMAHLLAVFSTTASQVSRP